MLAGVCVCVLAVAWLVRGTRHKGLKRLEHGDLVRLRLLSDQMQREEIFPFE